MNPQWTKGVELCNRTACQTAHDVNYYNKVMRAWYCVRCARLINGSDSEPICINDDNRKDYENNYKHQEQITWQEFKTAQSLFFK